MSSYRDERGYRVYPAGLPDYQLDPPAETTDELGLEDRCDGCGGELCTTCDGCVEGVDPEGCPLLCSCVARTVCVPDERWSGEMDRIDGEVDDAKVAEAKGRGRS